MTLLMDLASKGSLANILLDLQRGLGDSHFDNTISQKILIGIAQGMMYLHKKRGIYRDLKPANVLLDNNFQPRITDFSLSKIYLQDNHKNKPEYMVHPSTWHRK